MRTQLVTLKLGFKVNEQRLKDVVLREPTVADYIAAEVNAPVYRQYAFKVALISRLIEKLEGFDGEVTMGMPSATLQAASKPYTEVIGTRSTAGLRGRLLWTWTMVQMRHLAARKATATTTTAKNGWCLMLPALSPLLTRCALKPW